MSDSEVSDHEEISSSTPSASKGLFFDLSLEKNYEKVKNLSETFESYKWTRISSEPTCIGKKVINEHISQVYSSPENTSKFIKQQSAESGSSFVIQERFKPAWIKYFSGKALDDNHFTINQQKILFPLQNQMDISYLCKLEQKEADEEIRALYCIQAMQIAMTARSRILKHTQNRLAASNLNGGVMIEDDRDQGFTRTQTLIILPFRNAAYDCIKFMATMWKDRNGGAQVENLSRFEEEYGAAVPEDAEDAEAVAEAQRRDRRSESFKHVFRDNIDDCFRIGIKFTRKSMKLFSDFYSADIIIASPLGLRLVIDGADKNMKAGGDWDFMSSVELLVIDQVDAIFMQNWEHLEKIVTHCNRIPKKPHGCDFSRVRSAFLDGNARLTRQSIVLSRFAFPELNALLNNHDILSNCLGTVKYSLKGVESAGQLRALATASHSPSFYLLPMKSEKTNPTDVMAAARFNFFCGKVIPGLMRLIDSGHLTEGICIFIPSYYDFCQVRAHLKKVNEDGLLPDFTHLSEYSTNADISRARSRFFNGLAKIMIVSERFHFFRRYQIRGIRHLIFYGLPEFPEFYTQWLGMVGNVRKETEEEAGKKKFTRKLKAVKSGELDIEIDEVPTLIAPLDFLKLERIVGTEKARQLLEIDLQ